MAKKEIEDKEPSSKSLFGDTVKPVKEKEMKSSAPGLFDYVNMLFQKPKAFTELPAYTKSKQFFMMQRFFAIKFPIQAQMFNHTKMNGAEAVQYWCDSLSKMHNSTPSWIFNALKGAKKSKEEKKKELNVEEATIIEYCKRMQCSKRDLDEMYKFFPDDIQQELTSFEKMIKGSTLKK
ncbi:MAG: hypothetical protein WC979_00960 [Candidatus Pacearchaeota archaeon]|jgi:hypothetical protein|nr:hypothetical protein [Clostridia bacterium]